MAQGDILLAHAPTGLGKTAVALASALEYSLDEGRKAFFVTSRRSQHMIAVETLQKICKLTSVSVADVIASDAMCNCPPGQHSKLSRSRVRAVSQVLRSQVLHVQEVVELARRFKVCAYLTARKAARKADVLVCDYNYIFNRHRQKILRALGLRLEDCVVIVDEAHNLPARAREALSAVVSADDFSRLAAHFSGELATALLAVSGILAAEAKVVGGESKVPEDFLDRLLRRSGGSGTHSKALGDALEKASEDLPFSLNPLIDEVKLLLHEWREADRLRLLSPSGGGSLSLLALDPRPITTTVFREIHAGLLMSGTLHPGQMYIDVLGIPKERCLLRAYPSNFPPENRLLVASRHMSSSFRNRPESYRVFAREIYDLCFSIPGNVASFFPSYEMARRVGDIIYALKPPKTMLWERRGQSKEDKEGLLKVLKLAEGDRGYLLIAVQGASLSEGIDYPGNLLSGVIVAGLALNPPDLKVKAFREFYAKLFGRRSAYEYAYLYPALNKLVQCAGRCIRGPSDIAVVAILDNRLLRPFYKSRLPSGFSPAAPPDLPERVRTFFYNLQDGKYVADQERGRGSPDTDGVEGKEGH